MLSVKKNADFLRAYGLTFLLACLPIILFVPRLIDDYGRGVRGYYRWARSGFRPLADWLYAVFNLGGPATAVAPLGQLFSIPVSAIGALAISRTFQIGNPLLAVAATLPMYINPYFLENLSYGFDALSMTAALTLAILAAAQASRARLWPQWIAVAATLLACLLLYQPAFGAYVPLALAAWLWQRPIRSRGCVGVMPELGSVLAIVAAAVASLIFYWISMRLFWLERTGYGQSLSRLKSPEQLVLGLGGSIVAYLQSLWRDWHGTALLPMFMLLVIGFIVASTVRLSRCMAVSRSVLTSTAMAVVLVCVAPGPMYLLASINFIEVPRMNAYLGGLFGGLALPLAAWASEQACHRLIRLAAAAVLVAWLWCQVVFSYSYGHAVQAQREYEQARLSRLMDDISSLDPNRQAKTIHFEGAMPPSPLLANTTRKFPFMDRLVPRMINGPWTWGAKQLAWLGLDLRSARKDPASPAELQRAQSCQNDLTSRCTREHSLVLAGERLIVRMK